MRKFCFVCGKRTEKLYEGICEACSRKEEYVKLPKKIEITQCGKCGKMFFKNRLVDFNLEKILKNNLTLKDSAKIKGIEASHDGKKIAAAVLLSLPSGKEIREARETGFHISKIICSSCSRKHSGYYEAVLQLRGFDDKDLESMADIFERIGKKTFYRLKEVKGGFDVKIGNKLAINSVAGDIKKRFPSEMRKSKKIVTKIDGRDVYRKFVLIRKIRKD